MDFQQICIEKIEIQKFKKIRDLMLEPEAGANLIFGSYRCGKTSLCEFIQFALYGAGSVSLARENAEDALGKMILRADSVRFLIERSVIGGKEELTFSELDSGEAVQTDLTPGEYLTGLNQDSFDRITYFRQARFEAPYLKPKASFLKQLSSYQEDTKNLYQTLSEQETELFSYHNGQQNGSLDLLLAERDALQALVDERPKREEEIASISSTLQELGERIDENDRRRVLLKADMAAYTDDLKLSENKENAEEIHRSLQAKEKKLRIASYEVSNKIGKLSKAELEELRGDYNHLSLAVTGLAEARMALTSAEENLSFHERLFVGNDNPAHYTEEAAKIRKNKALRTLICLLGVLLMAGGVALFLLLNDADFDLITSVCAGSALVLCGIAALCVSTVFSGAIAKILQRNQKSSLHDFHEFLDRLRAHEKTTLVYREQVLRQEENCQRKSDEKDAVTQTIATVSNCIVKTTGLANKRNCSVTKRNHLC